MSAEWAFGSESRTNTGFNGAITIGGTACAEQERAQQELSADAEDLRASEAPVAASRRHGGAPPRPKARRHRSGIRNPKASSPRRDEKRRAPNGLP